MSNKNTLNDYFILFNITLELYIKNLEMSNFFIFYFLFQIGAIRELQSVISLYNNIRFYSKLVRLKVIHLPLAILASQVSLLSDVKV